ncbi:hypothetical protein PJE062_1791 [Pseudovibrio sp. JE062]|nr:hypothetical protein PJE062_1791 [Pseudovibrio sp. JE062]
MEGTRSALSKWIDSPEMIASEYLWQVGFMTGRMFRHDNMAEC